MRLLLCIAALLAPAVFVTAHDYIPGAPQTVPILLKGGTLYTVSDGVQETTDLLFENGRITQIARDIVPPENTRVIDVTGKHIYPGLIAAGTKLGLVEIGAVRATVDQTEAGRVNPDVQTHVAYNPDSEIIPTLRSNGIAYAEIAPDGPLLAGRSCLLNLDAWTKEDAAVNLNVGLHLYWPDVAISRGWWEQRSPEKQREAQKKEREELRRAFEDALAYRTAKAADPNIEVDSRWEAMRPIFDRTLPVFVHADDCRQIEEAVQFAREFGLRMILVGGREAWKLTELLKQNDIPVLYGYSHALPMRQDDPYDQAFATPRLLREAGVRFGIAILSTWSARNLAFDAGQAAAFGLDRDAALRAVTLSVAEILGADEKIGSLAVGKNATLVVSDGDILNPLTCRVTQMFIDGREVNLDDKHKELYRKYRAKQVDR